MSPKEILVIWVSEMWIYIFNLLPLFILNLHAYIWIRIRNTDPDPQSSWIRIRIHSTERMWGNQLYILLDRSSKIEDGEQMRFSEVKPADNGALR